MGKTLAIEGMSCGHCTARVTKALQGVKGVSKVEVSLEKKNAVVEGESLDEAALKAAVVDAGYEVTKVT
jgi:copper ion binding protein